ncbi:hypothetical protein HK099_000624, partial [Clydaea vesicula]
TIKKIKINMKFIANLLTVASMFIALNAAPMPGGGKTTQDNSNTIQGNSNSNNNVSIGNNQASSTGAEVGIPINVNFPLPFP